MQITARRSFYRFGVVAAVAALTTVACNSSDYKTSNSTTPDSSTTKLNPAASATPAGQPATNQPKAKKMPVNKDTINNMGQVTTPTSELKPDANKEGVAKSGTATPPSHPAPVHHRKKASATVVMTEKTPGAVMPQFPGGQDALNNYVNDHINYPKNAIDDDVAGVVRISFVVDENGRITKAKIISPQKLGDGLDEEALRVVNNMPYWKPGTIHGKKVKTRLELPISFQVES